MRSGTYVFREFHSVGSNPALAATSPEITPRFFPLFTPIFGTFFCANVQPLPFVGMPLM
jgi:hypothetical protein